MAGTSELPAIKNRRSRAGSVKCLVKPFTTSDVKCSTKPFTDRKFWQPILIALGVLAFAACAIIFIPKLANLPVFSAQSTEDPYAAYRAIYTEVKNYNFAHGGDKTLEQKVIKALDRGTDNISGYYFHLMAAAEYYYGVRDYNRALSFAEEAENYAPTDSEYEALLLFYVKCYRQLGDLEKSAYYQEVYDEFTYVPDACEDAEENDAE